MSTTQQRRTLWNKQITKRNDNLFTNKLSGHVIKGSGIEVFLISKNESAVAGTNHLVSNRSRKSGSIQERSLTKFAPGVVNFELTALQGAATWRTYYLSVSSESFVKIAATVSHNVADRQTCKHVGPQKQYVAGCRQGEMMADVKS